MYARLHAQKCKRPLNVLFHALSKPQDVSNTILSPNICAVLRAAALATGCQVSINYMWGSTFDLRQNKALGTPHKGFTRN